MKILYSALVTILLLTTGCMSANKTSQLEDPRAIDSAYSGTKRIDVFETLIAHSFAYDNKEYFKSMIFACEPQKLTDSQTKPLLMAPNGNTTKFKSIHLTKMNPHYSFPHLPPKSEILGIIEAKYPKNGNSRITVGWPIAAIDGSIFIVQPLYSK